MNIPEDCPLWIERAFKAVEDSVSEKLAKSKTADEAMKATGAYSMFLMLKEFVESEALRQAQAEKQRIASLHARPRADA